MTAKQDNTWGRGYLPLPTKLRGLGRLADAFHRGLNHKAWPAEHGRPETHMLTVSAAKLSIMRLDMQSLMELGLARIQVNEPGTLAFYFEV
jgi:hypothetical protein